MSTNWSKFAALAFVFVYLGLILSQLAEGLVDTSRALRTRTKRAYLVYQPGLNWVQLVMGIGLPIEIQDNSITMGAVVKSYYELPNNVTYYTRPTIDIPNEDDGRRRRRRFVTMPSRWEIYRTIQDFLRSFGYADGKSCLLNSVCETSQHPFDRNSGLLAELLHMLLTPSTTHEDIPNPFDRDFHSAEKTGKEGVDCQLVYPCEGNIIKKFSNLLIS